MRIIVQAHEDTNPFRIGDDVHVTCQGDDLEYVRAVLDSEGGRIALLRKALRECARHEDPLTRAQILADAIAGDDATLARFR